MLGIMLCKTILFLALKPISSLQGGGNGSYTSLIGLAEEFVDEEVDVVMSRFPREDVLSSFGSHDLVSHMQHLR
jgi:hypothetical protein